MPSERTPINDAAQRVLDVLGENTEDIIDEAAEETWTGEDDWEEVIGSPEERAHNDRTFAAVLRALVPLLQFAADEADKRADKATLASSKPVPGGETPEP